LPGNGFSSAVTTLSFADGPTLRAAAGSVLYLVLIGLLTVGVSAALRDSGLVTAVVVGVLYVVPLIADVMVSPVWRDRLDRYGPTNAGLAIQATKNIAKLPIGPWPGLGVLALWTLAALAAGCLVLRLRDA
jgi:ABC-2 type transport system permease protein